MTTITEFLNARLDEDEAVAREASVSAGHEAWAAFGYKDIAGVGAPHPDHPDGEEWYLLDGNLLRQSGDRPLAEYVARHDPARVLREITAKRAIIEICVGQGYVEDGPCSWRTSPPEAPVTWFTLAELAAVYADHPDYQQEWAP